jgi:hypothetical protein
MSKTNAFLIGLSLTVFAGNGYAQSKADSCAAYAREAAGSRPTTTGPGRGAARGAAVTALFGGNAGRGAAGGALIGGARRMAQRSRSFDSYYDQCMQR